MMVLNAKGILQVLNAFGLNGTITEISAAALNRDRVQGMKRKSSAQGKNRRKKLRTIKKGYLDDEKLKDSLLLVDIDGFLLFIEYLNF